MEISVVSPVYHAEKIISQLVHQIEKNVREISEHYEIILVEDGSSDNSWPEIEKIVRQNNKVKGIRLGRNFGQHRAITAGLDHAQGEWIVVMDCDLQDRPEEIKKLYDKTQEGSDVVLASRFKRKDAFLKRFFSKTFYKALSYLTGYKHDESVANFEIYNRKVISAVSSMRESIRYFPTMVRWVGFKSTKIKVDHAFREEGKSNYNFRSFGSPSYGYYTCLF